MTPIENCRARTAHFNSTLIAYSSGKKEYYYDGKFYTENEFREAFPLSSKIRIPNELSAENPDGTKRWMQD